MSHASGRRPRASTRPSFEAAHQASLPTDLSSYGGPAVADSSNVVPESNEGNNTRTNLDETPIC
jgi:hypothetical protein